MFFKVLFSLLLSDAATLSISTLDTKSINILKGTEKLTNFELKEILQESIIPEFLKLEKNQDLIFLTLQDEPPSQCLTHVKIFLERLFNLSKNATGFMDLRDTWVLQMVDSWGKLPESGLLSGHLNAYGDYDECVNVEAEVFDGQYCWVYLVPSLSLEASKGIDVQSLQKKGAVSFPELMYHISHPVGTLVMPSTTFCVPSTCSAEEVQGIVKKLVEAVELPVTPNLAFCQTKETSEISSSAWAMIGVLTIFGILTIAGSIVDIFLKNPRKGKGFEALIAFSFPKNFGKWKNTKGDSGFACIHGIRCLSTLWVILSHTLALYTTGGPLWNSVDINKIYTRPWHIYFLMNSFFSVDSFFAMSGLLASYGILKTLEKTEGKSNMLMLYLHRYLRLTPSYAIILGILATLFQYFGSGPYFSIFAKAQAKMCRKHWWHNLIYLNNVYPYDIRGGEFMCEKESWYIANDMQFFIACAIFTFLLWKWERIGLLLLAGVSIASVLAPGITVWTEKLPPTQIFWKGGNKRGIDVYIQPWYRFGPYAAGVWMGFLLFKLGKKKVILPKFAVISGWLLSSATALSILLGVIPYFDPENEDDPLWAGIYAGVSRFAWGGVICWVIFACSKGYGGWVNDFLSMKVFVPLGRLTLCIYLSSYSVQTLLQLTTRQPGMFQMYHVLFDLSWLNKITANLTIVVKGKEQIIRSKSIWTNVFFSNAVMCFFVGFWLSMLFESPFIALEKILLASGGEKRKEAKEDANGNQKVSDLEKQAVK